MHVKRFVIAGMLVAATLALILAACGGGGSGGGGSTNIPRFAFLANFNDNTVSAYTVNATTGQLRHNGYVPAGAGPRSVAVDPANKVVYVANQNSGDISAYSINADGTLSEIDQNGSAAGTTVASGTGPHSITIDPSGKFVYVANMGATTADGSIASFRILDGGALSPKTGNALTGGRPQSVALHPSGRFLYAANFGGGVSAFSIENGVLKGITCSANCNASVAADFAAGTDPFSVAIDPSGRFAYVANFTSGDVSAFKIHTDGTLEHVNCTPSSSGGQSQLCSNTDFGAGTNPVSIAIDPTGRFVYTANLAFGEVAAFQIDPAGTGALLRVGCNAVPNSGCSGILNFSAGTNSFSVRVDPSGRFLFVANQGSNDVSIFDITPDTGFLTNARTVRGRIGPAELAMTRGSSPVTYTPRFAYVANSGSNEEDISAFSIDAVGALHKISCTASVTITCNGTNFAGTAPSSIAAEPSGRFVYVADAAGARVFEIDAGSGALLNSVSGSPFTAGTTPSSVAVDSSGRLVYVANLGGGVSAFKIDATNSGALDSTSGSPFTAGTEPFSVTVDPTGRFAYVANLNSGISAFTINANTGALDKINCGADAVACVGASPSDFAAGTHPQFVTVDPTGRFAYAVNGSDGSISLFAISATTGALTKLDCLSTTGAACTGNPNIPTAFTTNTGPRSLAIEPTGRFAYLVTSEGISVYEIEAGGGLIELAGSGSSFPVGPGPISIAVDPSGKFVYLPDTVTGNVSGFGADLATGKLRALGVIQAGSGAVSITVTRTIQ